MATQTARWVWAAVWDDGQYEIVVLPEDEARRRRDLAMGLAPGPAADPVGADPGADDGRGGN